MPVGYISIAIAWLTATSLGLLLWDEATILRLAREDGPFETIGALFFLIASMLCLVAYRRDTVGNRILGRRTNRNIFFLFLAVVFFLGFGEEISWGQRVFMFDTPEAIRAVNVQQEFNLHNLVWLHTRGLDGVEKTGISALLTVHKLFDLFWLTFFCLLPLGVARSHRLRGRISEVNLPLVPAFIALLFLVNFALSQLVQLFLTPELSHSRIEVKEHNFAFLFVVSSLWFARHPPSGPVAAKLATDTETRVAQGRPWARD